MHRPSQRHSNYVFTYSALASILASAAPAFAQNLTLEEVIVTAQKREQTVQDIPASVAAVSEEMLERTNSRDFNDLAKITSGITIAGGVDGAQAIIRIRGIGSNPDVPAIRPSVGIFINEVPLGSISSAFNNLTDIERIEVLKGPQSTLFGKEVSSGAISLFTKRPNPEDVSAYVEGNFGNLELEEYRLGGNLPLGEKFALRGSAYYAERGDFIDNIAPLPEGSDNDEMGAYDKHGYRLRLGFYPTDNFEAILSYEDHDIRIDGSDSIAREYGDLYTTWEQRVLNVAPEDSQLIVTDVFDREASHSAPTLRETESSIVSLNMNWELSENWTATSVTSDQDYWLTTTGTDNSERINASGEAVPATADTSVGPYKINSFFQNQRTETFTQELRFTYDSENWSSIIGGFYADTELTSVVPFTGLLGAINPDLIFVAGGISDLHEDITEWAIFNHNIWTIREGLEFTFGLRYSDTEKESVKGQLTGFGPLADLNTPPVPVTPWGDNIPTQRDSWDAITGTAKLTWWMNDEIAIYGGWDRGFKAGGHNVCKGTDELPDCPEPFDEEIANNFEVGFKGRFLDNTLVWNSSVFYQLYDDYQVDIQDEEGIGNSVQNAAKVEVQGIETEFQWLASANLLIDGNISYIDARWDEYEDAACLRPQYQAIVCDPDTLTQDLSGDRLNYTSPWTANLNVTWSDELSNGIGWYLRGEYAFRDDRFFFPDLDPDLQDASYFLLNASLGFTDPAGTWDVILWGKNLTDEDYILSASRNRDAGNPQFGTTPVEGYRVIAGEERTYGITLKYRFNGG